MTESTLRPDEPTQEAIERYRAQLNRRQYTPEQLVERRARHAHFVEAMRVELQRHRQRD